ncbi:Scr1 family TA system antitoxin-like transcriptional regulator [Micromonospora rifamycinica]|uniref:Scr1 family TA system antitoxin-like transcriptional regulator n=1 Tax=Micromonospora rifamycinica TaxID=291594 RepID=UPI003F54169C
MCQAASRSSAGAGSATGSRAGEPGTVSRPGERGEGKGWWHAYGDASPDWFELYVGLEQAGSRIRFSENTLVPGLLQTRRYASGIYEVDQPEMGQEGA